MLQDVDISPKQSNENNIYSQNSWFFYYAGYSDGFIKQTIEKYRKAYKDPILVDPWNGSGTTTLVASMMDLTCYGFDINPVMIVIAKAKLFDIRRLDINEIRRQLLSMQPIFLSKDEYLEDPLNIWFTIEALSMIRQVENVIQNITSIKKNSERALKIKKLCNIEFLSNEVCFYYLAFFTTLKQFAKPFIGSNPTWVKSKNIEKLNLNASELITVYLNAIKHMEIDYSEGANYQKISLSIGDSKNIPLKNESADMVITSPPYCTRIDYAVYTKIELSLLGYTSNDIQDLRREMIGTPTIRRGFDHLRDLHPNQFLQISGHCVSTLEDISLHQSKAAKSYYYKTYFQYFIGMYKSIIEIYRILRKNGIAVIVVQDSWFKDIYVDVPNIIMEFSQNCGFTIIEKKDYKVRNNLNYINSKSRKYKHTKKAVESVIVFKKG